jgi:hypothetical protein
LIRQVPPVSPSKSLKEAEFPLQDSKSVDGIVSYLTRKHGGNVHDTFPVKELSRLLQSRLIVIIPSGLSGMIIPRTMSLISLLTHLSSQWMSQISGFAGISTNTHPPDSLHNRKLQSEIVGG